MGNGVVFIIHGLLLVRSVLIPHTSQVSPHLTYSPLLSIMMASSAFAFALFAIWTLDFGRLGPDLFVALGKIINWGPFKNCDF